MLDPIVRGCDWQAVIVVEPTSGRTVADVVAELTGAEVSVRLHGPGSSVLGSGCGSVISARERTILVEFASTKTKRFAECIGCVLDVRITTKSGCVRPIHVRDRIAVHETTGAA